MMFEKTDFKECAECCASKFCSEGLYVCLDCFKTLCPAHSKEHAELQSEHSPFLFHRESETPQYCEFERGVFKTNTQTPQKYVPLMEKIIAEYAPSHLDHFFKETNDIVVPFACGFMNIGNTCYMNATIHAISSITPFVEYFLHDRFKNRSNGVLGFEFHRIYLESSKGIRKRLCLTQLRKSLNEEDTKFNFPDPQDSQEYVRYVYKKILKEYPDCPLKLSHFTLTSKEGNEANNQNVDILRLSLPTGTCKNDTVRFDDILKFNLSSYLIKAPPQFMIINMLLDEPDHKKKGINLQVDVDNISLAPYCAEGSFSQYQIVAAMHHYGAFAEDGHDMTYRRIPKGWFFFNDLSVTNVDLSEKGLDGVNLGHSYHLVLQRSG